MKSRFFSLMTCLFLFYLMSIPLHEWGHYWVGQIFGYEGQITFPTLLAGLIETSTDTHGWRGWLYGFAGGGTVFAFYALLWAQAHWSPTRWDTDDEVALTVIGCVQLVYALFEASTPEMAKSWVMGPISLAVALAVVIAYRKQIASYLGGQ